MFHNAVNKDNLQAGLNFEEILMNFRLLTEI